MADSSTSRMVTSVCLDSASSPVNMARKYGEQADRMILQFETFFFK